MAGITTVVSSPGKVLLAGGYLVLDPKYSGVVISTSSRFYTAVHPTTQGTTNQIQVRSPQFSDGNWDYSISVGDRILVTPSPNNASENKFIHVALQSICTLKAEINGVQALLDSIKNSLEITVVGDNDFYSQRAQFTALNLPRSSESLSKVPPFSPTHVTLANVHKSGLGSSAALVTSLVCALLLHFRVISPAAFSEGPNTDGDHSDGHQNADRRLAHNLAQFVHCFAQGKVGSGFDVSAAVFGSQIYTRFSPAALDSLLNDEEVRRQPWLPILSPYNQSWNYRAEPFKLPPLTKLMLADINAGSKTPVLVKAVLAWRKNNPQEADALWTAIDELNRTFASTLAKLSELHKIDPPTYAEAVKYLSSLQPVQWTANPWQPPNEIMIVENFYTAHLTSQAIRSKMLEMGKLSQADIEPPEQTALLNSCVRQAGVIGGGVPGAGGYDAIWLLVCDPVDCTPDLPPSARVARFWDTYTELEVSTLSATESMARGSRMEDIDTIPGLKSAIFGV